MNNWSRSIPNKLSFMYRIKCNNSNGRATAILYPRWKKKHGRTEGRRRKKENDSRRATVFLCKILSLTNSQAHDLCRHLPRGTFLSTRAPANAILPRVFFLHTTILLFVFAPECCVASGKNIFIDSCARIIIDYCYFPRAQNRSFRPRAPRVRSDAHPREMCYLFERPPPVLFFYGLHYRTTRGLRESSIWFEMHFLRRSAPFLRLLFFLLSLLWNYFQRGLLIN